MFVCPILIELGYCKQIYYPLAHPAENITKIPVTGAEFF
jgi:hypothetical protein